MAGYVWCRYTDLLVISQTLETSIFETINPEIKYVPVLKALQFSNFDANDEVIIYTITGNAIAKFKVQHKILSNNYRKGIYIVQVRTKNGMIAKKIII